MGPLPPTLLLILPQARREQQQQQRQRQTHWLQEGQTQAHPRRVGHQS
jgi:hypothetical protein